jgi:hypothetical protein
MPRSTHLAAPVALGGCEGRPIWPVIGTDWLPSVDVHEQSISLGVSLFRTHRLPLTTHTSVEQSLVVFQPAPDLAGGLVLVLTQGPFV